MAGHAYLESDWRREAFRTNLWITPTVVTGFALLLLAATYTADRAA